MQTREARLRVIVTGVDRAALAKRPSFKWERDHIRAMRRGGVKEVPFDQLSEKERAWIKRCTALIERDGELRGWKDIAYFLRMSTAALRRALPR